MIRGVLWLKLARNDGKPDNRVLNMLDEVKAGGFGIEAIDYNRANDEYRVIYTWDKPDRATTRKGALASLAKTLGQEDPELFWYGRMQKLKLAA